MVNLPEKEQRSKTMKGATATKQGEAGTPVKILSAQVLGDRVNEIHEMIARRAYERFEQRAGEHGQDIEDWVQAESELLHVCRHDLRESAEAIILHAELPGTFSADQLKVSVEPRCLIVSGERDVEVICGDDKPPHTERRPQRIFRVHNLPAEVDPSKATAVLKSKILEIVMPKVSAEKRPNDKAKEALSGG
jgi:HSP20 family molecular chaperone IbpA